LVWVPASASAPPSAVAVPVPEAEVARQASAVAGLALEWVAVPPVSGAVAAVGRSERPGQPVAPPLPTAVRAA
jgi:hypothetical protein